MMQRILVSLLESFSVHDLEPSFNKKKKSHNILGHVRPPEVQLCQCLQAGHYGEYNQPVISMLMWSLVKLST